MNKISQFEKVSFEQFKKDWMKAFGDGFKELSEARLLSIIIECYNSIKLPKRATAGSAGYDFYLPFHVMLEPGEAQVVPTGIRCKMDNGWVLKCYPRSGHGFKYGVHLANTVGIIDSDYYNADNEGHIQIKLVNDAEFFNAPVSLNAGSGFCQGIFLPFGITVDDEADAARTGGFGSTGA